MCDRDQLIRGLLACGFVEDVNPTTTKYRVFERGGRTFFVGRSGGLRTSRTGKVGDSVSLTGRAVHKAFIEVGRPTYRFESTQQALSVFHIVCDKMSGKAPASA